MSASAAWRNDALNDALSAPSFAPVKPKKRVPRASKYSEETEAAVVAPGRPMSPGLGKLRHKTPRSPVGTATSWDPSKSPALSKFGYTMTSQDLKPGMSVAQWPAEVHNTIHSLNHLTKEGTEITYTSGEQAMVGRNASFAQGIPQQ